MGYTRGQILDEVATVIGDNSTKFRTHLTTVMNNELFKLWDRHDWSFRHKSGQFTTVSGTEFYNLGTTSPDLRSTTDLEIVYDKTNGQFINRVELKDLRKNYPEEDTSGQPIFYAPWGNKEIYLHENPDGAYLIKYLYLSKPTLPTSDSHNLETVCGLPDYLQPVFYEMVLSKALFYTDDSRYQTIRSEIEGILLPRAIQADMQHTEETARFKFWEEAIAPSGGTFNDYLRGWWWGDKD